MLSIKRCFADNGSRGQCFFNILISIGIRCVSIPPATNRVMTRILGGHVGMVFGWLIPCFFVMCIAASMAEMASAYPTSAGLYYFSAKLAPPRWSALASWICGWANFTGQVTLVCSIDFTWSVLVYCSNLAYELSSMNSAQMITTAIAVGSDGNIVLGNGATYGILLAILFSHAIVCSAATAVLARINLVYVMINGRRSNMHVRSRFINANTPM